MAFFEPSYIECQRRIVHLKAIKFEPLLATFLFLKQSIDGGKFNANSFKWMNLKHCLNVILYIHFKTFILRFSMWLHTY